MGKGKVKIWYDEESDILYISFGRGVAVDSEEVDEGGLGLSMVRMVS